MKHSKKLIFLSVFLIAIAVLFENCNRHSESSVNFKTEKTFLINDDKGLIRHIPNRVTCENDDEINLFIGPDKYLRFSTQTNSLSVLFDSIQFNLDSVIKSAYQNTEKHYINYLPHSEEKLKNIDKSLFKLTPAIFTKENNYFPLSIRLEYEYNPATIASMADKREADSLRSRYGNAKIIDAFYECFVITTDKNQKQLTLIPLINNSKDYLSAIFKGCYYGNKHLYCPLITLAVETERDAVSLKGLEPSYFFMDYTIDRDNILSAKNIIEKKKINVESYGASLFLSRKVSYFNYNNTILASVGKEILNLTNNSQYTCQPVLEEKEYLTNFRLDDKYLIFTTDLYEKTKRVSSQIGSFGATDSIARCFLKIQDIKTNELIYNKELNTKAVYTFTPFNNLYEYYEKKDSLILNKYSIKVNE